MNTTCKKNKLEVFTQVIKLFALCGLNARFSFEPFSRLFNYKVAEDFAIQVVREQEAESFNLVIKSESLDVKVIDIRPKSQQLLLQFCDRAENQAAPKRFLCGKHGAKLAACIVSPQVSSIEEAGECYHPLIPRPMRVWRRFRGVTVQPNPA